MDLREFMSIRRAYNRVRQQTASDERLTFEEFSILCRLDVSEAPLKTSEIAEYQHALRPTMTHRTNHLAELGLIDRAEGESDRRNVVCAISDKGRARLRELATLTRGQIPSGGSLSRTSAERIIKYGDAMGSIFCKAGDLVLLGVLASEGQTLTIMQLVDALGLLQPTVSMSVVSLCSDGQLVRGQDELGSHSTRVHLTAAGLERAQKLNAAITAAIVRRKRS